MSSKDSSKQNTNKILLKSQSSTKSKKTVLKDVSNQDQIPNISIDQIKKEDCKSIDDKAINKQISSTQKSQKSELQKKTQELKVQNNIKKQQKQIKVKIQQSLKKLPDIHQSPSNKQNQQRKLAKKSKPVSTHLKHESDNIALLNLQQRKNNRSSQGNYSIINGKKVYMSEQDVIKLKRLKLEYKKREQQIKKKVVAHQLLVQKMKTEQIQSKQKRIEEQRQKRLKSIQQRQRILSRQREQKLQRFKEQNKKLKEIKETKKLYQKMEQEYHKIEQKQKQDVQGMIKSRIGQGTINYDSIKQHEKQYLEKNRQNIQNSRIRIKSKIKQMQEEFNHLNLHKSQFYQKVKHQKKSILHQLEQNYKKRKVCSQKIKQYQQIVRQNYMPTVVKGQKSQQKKIPSFNLSQVHNIGNQYMKQGSKLIDRNKSINRMQKIKQQQVQKSTKYQYKNYLHQHRTQSSPQLKSKSHSKSKLLIMQDELKTINATINPKQKYQKIKLLHNKIEKDLKSTLPLGGKIKLKSTNYSTKLQSQNQVRQIKAKLQLLNGLDN